MEKSTLKVPILVGTLPRRGLPARGLHTQSSTNGLVKPILGWMAAVEKLIP